MSHQNANALLIVLYLQILLLSCTVQQEIRSKDSDQLLSQQAIECILTELYETIYKKSNSKIFVHNKLAYREFSPYLESISYVCSFCKYNPSDSLDIPFDVKWDLNKHLRNEISVVASKEVEDDYPYILFSPIIKTSSPKVYLLQYHLLSYERDQYGLVLLLKSKKGFEFVDYVKTKEYLF